MNINRYVFGVWLVVYTSIRRPFVRDPKRGRWATFTHSGDNLKKYVGSRNEWNMKNISFCGSNGSRNRFYRTKRSYHVLYYIIKRSVAIRLNDMLHDTKPRHTSRYNYRDIENIEYHQCNSQRHGRFSQFFGCTFTTKTYERIAQKSVVVIARIRCAAVTSVRRYDRSNIKTRWEGGD